MGREKWDKNMYNIKNKNLIIYVCVVVAKALFIIHNLKE